MDVSDVCDVSEKHHFAVLLVLDFKTNTFNVISSIFHKVGVTLGGTGSLFWVHSGVVLSLDFISQRSWEGSIATISVFNEVPIGHASC